jgi:16S rRNA (cytidine1402-2'-O)-methyltransferase
VLYIVPTPVGNLQDITLRAKNLLQNVETIICEDPRITQKLLKLLEISTSKIFVQYIKNQHINLSGLTKILEKAKAEEFDILLVSDAGMPGLSDPGFEVIKLAQDFDLKYTVLPGPDALIPAVIGSGFVSKEFTFLGFLPIKKGRKKAWQRIKESQYPLVIYESVHRIEKFISEAKEILEPSRKMCIMREISKAFEEITVAEISQDVWQNIKTKGEFVVVIDKLR